MKRVIEVAFLVFGLCGCGAHGLIGDLPVIDDPDEAAVIYVIRVSSISAKGMNFRISLDGFALLGIGNGEYTEFRVPPREHTLAVTSKEGMADRTTRINVTCEPKGKYYFLVKPAMSSVRIEQIAAEEAQRRIAESKYLDIEIETKRGLRTSI